MEKILIVGGGLAGSTLAAEAYERGISFDWVISENIPAASFAAYGMCNPVHFHNIVPAWKTEEFFDPARSFYLRWQTITRGQFYHPIEINHLITDQNELIQWRQQVESTDLWKYTSGDLSTGLNSLINPSLIGNIPIHASFFVDITSFVLSIREYLKANILNADLQFNDIKLGVDGVTWNHTHYEKVIFTEGSHGRFNAYFSTIPFNPCKGEILILKIPGLKLNTALHKKIVLVPLDNEEFICGATYEWDDLSSEPTEKAKTFLLNSLKEILNSQFSIEVIDQKAGVRPTISDRRPVVGWHPLYTGIGILNGLGTKGLMLGPSCANNLLDNLQTDSPILADWDVLRFKKRLLKNP